VGIPTEEGEVPNSMGEAKPRMAGWEGGVQGELCTPLGKKTLLEENGAKKDDLIKVKGGGEGSVTG